MTIELSVALLPLHEGSHYQRFDQKVLALTMQFAFYICITLYALLSAAQHWNFQRLYMMNMCTVLF